MSRGSNYRGISDGEGCLLFLLLVAIVWLFCKVAQLEALR